MKNILLNIIKNNNKCTHKNALLHSDCGYCPDCGEFLVKNYYLVRCSRCDIKREAKIAWGEILPKDKYCTNCGGEEFYIEKIDKINFIDANFAVYLKEKSANTTILHPEMQIWSEDGRHIKQLSKLKS